MIRPLKRRLSNIFIVLLALLAGNFSIATAQIYHPVHWTFHTKKVSDKAYELISHATIGKGWHLYSQFLSSNDGPVATDFTYTKSPAYALDGKTVESKLISKYDPTFKMELKYFEDSATFTQKIKVNVDSSFSVKGNVYFMVCNDSMCLPPKAVDFNFKIKQGSPNAGSSIFSTDTASAQGHSGLVILLLGFLGGLAALMTPCVFPMIPLTVSFFTKQSADKRKGFRNAVIYGLSIILIYVAFGGLITIIVGPDAMNAFATNEWVNLLFFLIFVIFGLSFLGAFEITLPNSWTNKSDSASEKGGIVGIFFMALTLAIVSFSCTGPIVGSVLAGAAVGKNYFNLVLGMFGFSFALALPFTLFAAFPGWMNNLPKSGGWLNNVKVVLGLLEIAFAMKFLSIVDLAGLHIGWLHFNINGPIGIMRRGTFIAIWIVLFSMIGLYLLGKIRFKHDSPTDYVSIPKFVLAVISFAFVVYLIPGMWGAPLKIISGFPPPEFYNEGWPAAQVVSASSSPRPTVIDKSHGLGCPLNLNCYHDYDAALAEAKKENKPLMIDFTGLACVNCRKMEENVWSDPKVLERIRDDYVLVSLYVDDKTPLPKNEQYVSKTTGEKVATYGNKWSDLETARYKTNSQPWYALVDDNGKELTQPRGYNPDIPQYINFLDKGKTEFEKRNKQ